jgi:hypothetical protein
MVREVIEIINARAADGFADAAPIRVVDIG